MVFLLKIQNTNKGDETGLWSGSAWCTSPHFKFPKRSSFSQCASFTLQLTFMKILKAFSTLTKTGSELNRQIGV